MSEIKLKIVIDGKEAIATLNLTEKELADLKGGFGDAGKSSAGFTNQLNNSLENARNSIMGLKEVWSVFSGMFGGAVSAYQEAEVAEIQLTTAMKQRGQYTEAALQDLQEYAANLQLTTTFEGDEAIALMGNLQAMGLSNQQTKEATKLGANLAALMGTDLASTSKLLADLFAGDATMINRYVKGLDEAVMKSGDMNAIMAMLNQVVGGQAEALAQASSGPLKQFQNSFGDLTEAVGGTISVAILPFVKGASTVMNALNSISPAITGVIGTIGMLTAAMVTLKITGLTGNITSILAYRVNLATLIPSLGANTAATGVATAAHIGFGASVKAATLAIKGFLLSNPLGWAIMGVTAIWGVVEAFDLLGEKSDELKEQQKAYYESLSLSDLRKEQEEFSKAQTDTASRYYEVQKEINAIANKDYRTTEERSVAIERLKFKNEELRDLKITINKLGEQHREIATQIAAKEAEIKAQMEGQVSTLKDRIEKIGKSNKEQQIIDLENKRKSDIEAVNISVKDQQEKSRLLAGIEKLHQEDLKKINEKEQKDRQNANRQASSNAEQQAKRLSDLEFELSKERATNKDRELLELKNWYDTRYEIAKNNAQLLSALDEVYTTKKQLIEVEYSVPEEALPEFVPEDIDMTDVYLDEYEKVQRLKLQMIDNEYARQQALADYEHNLAVEKFGDLESLKLEHDMKIAEIDKLKEEAITNNAVSTLQTIGAAFGKHTLAYKMMASTQALISTWQMAQEAYKSAATIPLVGFILAPAAAAAAVATGLGNVAKINSTNVETGYAEGGLLPKGKAGFVEGWHNEIIAPEETFIDVLNSSIIPRLSPPNPVFVNAGNNDFSSKIESLFNKIDAWQTKLSVIMDTNDVNKNLKQNDRFIARYGYY
jgi:hypothetical protein